MRVAELIERTPERFLRLSAGYESPTCGRFDPQPLTRQRYAHSALPFLPFP